MFKNTIKVIALGLGLSVAATVPVAMSQQAATKADIESLERNLVKKMDEQTNAITMAINNQTTALTKLLAPHSPVFTQHVPVQPSPPPTRIVHIHRHYYPRDWPWCPPPWFVGY
jgi:hypothetical protein